MLKKYNEPRWLSREASLPWHLPEEIRNWLFDRGSLTARLIVKTNGHFRVKKIRHTWQRPSMAEAKILGIDDKQRVLVREVVLMGFDKAMVYGRTLISLRTLVGEMRSLKYLQSRSLGSYLFKQKALKRFPIEVARLKSYHALFASIKPYLTSPTENLWVRRSLFAVGNRTLLVTEAFLPEVFDKTRC